MPYNEGQDYVDGVIFESFFPPQCNKHSYMFFDIDKGDIVVDGGAYEGLFGAQCYSWGATVISAEPEQAAFNNLQYCSFRHQAALSDKDGVAVFCNNKFASHVVSQEATGNVATITIDTLLSKFLTKKTLASHDILLKLDIEGSEYNALLGARHTIKTYKPKIIAETYHDAIFRTFTVDEICNYLHELHPGYNIMLWGFNHNYNINEYAVHAVIAW